MKIWSRLTIFDRPLLIHPQSPFPPLSQDCNNHTTQDPCSLISMVRRMICWEPLWGEARSAPNLVPSGITSLWLGSFLVACCQGAIFTFQISTFDKSRFPRALIIAWKSHHSPYSLSTSTPLQLTHQDEHGQEHRTYSTQFWYSRVVRRQQQQLVLQDISTLGILTWGDLWRLPPHPQEPSQAGASSSQNLPDDKLNAWSRRWTGDLPDER